MQVDYHAHRLNRSELDVNSPSVKLEAFVNDHVKQHVSTFVTSSKQALEHGIEIGPGGIYLHLTLEQYNKLKRG